MPATMIKSLVTVVTLLLAGNVVDAKLRGSFEDLKRKATNPRLSNEIRGKTLKELGVKTDLAHAMRNLQDGGNNRPSGYLQFFAVYEEFGPSLSRLGETAGLNGLIYDFSKFDNNELHEDDVIGALKGSCSVVGNSDDHFCTYEMLFVTPGNQGFGTVIASGSLIFDEDDGGALIVQAAGDDFEGYNGGLCTVEFVSTGRNQVITGELALS